MSSAECKSGVNHNIYRGLYPIREVKQYYKREFVNEKPLYICTFDRNNCQFKTWKYSQHIARHIHLKHIGIKELKCDEPNCAKTFKRPESLVQHQKNHLCGFGIDSAKMKDPTNRCGVKNIKKYYFRELDNDYYVFGCKWIGCEFVTNNSGSIRRHVHNQHLCPHSVANINANNSANSGDEHQNNSSSQSVDNFPDNSSGVEMPLVEIIELEGQAVIPQTDSFNDNPFAISANPVDIDSESDSSSAKMSSTDSLYSLKNYSNLYRKVEIEGEVYFQCNCKSQFITKSQTSLVRHIWTDIGRNDFECDINGCNARFDNELSLNKHKKNDHNFEFNNNSSFDMPTDMLEIVSNAGLNATTVSQTASALTNGKSSTKSRTSIQTSDEMSSLENLSQHFRQTLVDNQVVYDCKCGQFQTTSTASLLRHIALHKGIDGFECNLCNAQFDSEPSLYRHIEIDHNSNHFTKVSTLPSNSKFDSNYANNSNFNDESISSIENIRDDPNSGNNSKDFKSSFGSERNNSGLYSLKNYEKYFKRVKINEEIHYKCTFCSFSTRSQTTLIQHIWSHTGMARFQCDFDGCLERFSTESELFRHRKSHNTQTIQTITSTPNSSYSAFEANPQIDTNHSIGNTSTNGADSLQSSSRRASTGNQIRKMMETKSERGAYSLKKYENCYTKVKSVDGIKFFCNCGRYQTKSQTSLVRHIWEHQSSKGFNGSVNTDLNQLECLNQSSKDLKATTNETIGRTEDLSVGEEMEEEYEECDEDLDEDLDEEAEDESFETSVANTSELRRSLTFKKYKNLANNETTNGETDGQNTRDVAGDELYLNSLIVKIEDRGFFCQWPECDFSDDLREPVVEHIRQTHSNEENSLVETSLEFEDNEIDGNYDELDELEEQSSCAQQTATYSIEQFESLIGKEFRQNKLIYLCKATNCLFETALNSSIIAHIQQNHIIETSFYANSSLKPGFGESGEPNLNRFLCKYDYCNASFPSFDSLAEHKKIHSKQMTQNCDYFDDNIEEEMEQYYNNGIKPIKTFKTYTYNGRASAENTVKFSKTITQSSGNELYVCQFSSHCGYSSLVRGNIIRHIRRHTGDKPFICHISGCNRRFAYSNEVKSHQHKDHKIN